MKDSYEDIIHLPHHISVKHPQMPLADRAAQFAPFAALTGHAEAVKETARVTDEWRELDENSKAILDAKLQMIREQLWRNPTVTITYFVPDGKKAGGEYVTVTGTIRKIDELDRSILIGKDTRILIEKIFDIENDFSS